MRRRAPPFSIASALLVIVVDVAAAQPSPEPTPFTPTIDDPMLATPAPAARALTGWDEVRGLLSTSATELRRADAAVARAEAGVRQARATLYPTVNAQLEGEIDLLHPGTAPGVGPGDGYTPTSPLVSLRLSAVQPLIDLPARHARAAASADRRAATWERADAERRVAQRVARAIIAVGSAERVAELNRIGLRQALERSALTHRTRELGVATELDELRADQDVALARTALIAGDENLRVAREALGLALGLDGAIGVGGALAGDGLVAAITTGCRPIAGEDRADIEAARADIVAARARTEQIRAGYWPTLDLTSNLFAITTDPAPGRVPSWTLSAVLSVPLWEGGLRAGLIGERAAAVADTVAVAADVERAARIEIAQAGRGEAVGGELVAAATEAARLAARIDAMTRRSFQMGRATSLELVQSAAALRQAEVALALREFERRAAQVDHLLSEARCVP